MSVLSWEASMMLIRTKRPNTACSGQLGIAAFFGSFQRLSKIPFSSIARVPPSCH